MNSENQGPEPPQTFDHWLVGFLTAVGLFALYGFTTFLPH
jgi:hypothetical protein